MSVASNLLVGPHLRYTGTTTATIWLETDGPAEVEILGRHAPTFHVEGHHYALVVIEDLEPGTVTPYEVSIAGEDVWPPLPTGARPARSIPVSTNGSRGLSSDPVGSECRSRSPTRCSPPEHPKGLGIDALWAYSRRLQAGSVPWPDALLLLGDQVYADEVPPETARFIRSRRDPTREPGEEVADFEEFTRLYRESWSDPDIRWLLSTVPSTMIFDDHDVRDDWNISSSWVDEMRALPWWDDRITGAFMSYWLYQHIGNLSPPELAEEEMLHLVQGDDDAGPRLREFARKRDRESASSRWAYYRDFGRSRVLVIDSRAARVLTEGRRDMIDEGEWSWIVEHCRGEFDHLIIASTLPVFMTHGIHHVQALSEAVCDGVWGARAARLAERFRRLVDLEHWPAFQKSFRLLVELLREIATDASGKQPATILVLGGDVHTSYVAKVRLGAGAEASRVYQIVCSPFRNPLKRIERRAIRLGSSRLLTALVGRGARSCGVPDVPVGWSFVCQPTFENSIGELVLDERAARLTISSPRLAGAVTRASSRFTA